MSDIRRLGTCTVLVVLFGIISSAVVAAEEPPREVYLTIDEVGGIDAAEIMREAIVAALVRGVGARWRFGTERISLEPPPWPPALEVTLNILPHDETSVRVVVQGRISVTEELVVEWDEVIRPDRAGRFLDPDYWQELVHHVQHGVRLLNDVRPTTLTIRGTPGATVSGLSDGQKTLDDEGQLSVSVIPFQTYNVLLQRPGYRDKEVVVTPSLEDLTLDLNQDKYLRHAISLSLEELAFPSVAYSLFDESTTWFATVGFTSYAGGLTPFTAFTAHAEDGDRSFFTSLPFLRTDLLGGMLFRDRDQPFRFWLQGGGFLRLHYPEGNVGLEPVLPYGATVRIGLDYELPRRFTFTAGMTTDLYVPRSPDFVDWSFGLYRLGPFILQTGLLHVGVRVVL